MIAKHSFQLLTIVIPARNEEGCICSTVQHLSSELRLQKVPHEIIVVDDGSSDHTWQFLQDLKKNIPELRSIQNIGQKGFGHAVMCGLNQMAGDAVIIMMADESDDCKDVIRYWQQLNLGYDCVFGTRFCRQAKISNYPWNKLILNRLGNFFIQVLFLLPYNDVTNAFKCYSRKAIEGMSPLISCHFNLTVEMPLKAIIRGYKWCVIPTNWQGRDKGISKWKIKEMGSRYLFILFYLWLEKSLSRKDYHISKTNG